MPARGGGLGGRLGPPSQERSEQHGASRQEGHRARRTRRRAGTGGGRGRPPRGRRGRSHADRLLRLNGGPRPGPGGSSPGEGGRGPRTGGGGGAGRGPP